MTDPLDQALEQMREYKRPVEGVARALGEYLNGYVDPISTPHAWASSVGAANVAIGWLKDNGYISDLGWAALKAEGVLK